MSVESDNRSKITIKYPEVFNACSTCPHPRKLAGETVQDLPVNNRENINIEIACTPIPNKRKASINRRILGDWKRLWGGLKKVTCPVPVKTRASEKIIFESNSPNK